MWTAHQSEARISTMYRRAAAVVLVAWSLQARSLYPILLALKLALMSASLVAAFLVLLALGAVIVFKYGPPAEVGDLAYKGSQAEGAPGNVYASDEKCGAQLGNYTEREFQTLLDSVPEEYRLKLIDARALLEGKPVYEVPADFEDDPSDPHPLAYSLIESAPLADACFRNGSPILVEAFGLVSEDGLKLNGARGWAVKRVQHRLKVWFDAKHLREPASTLDVLRKAPSAFAKNLRPAHLRLCRTAVSITPVTAHRLLSAWAGDVTYGQKASPGEGFFVFFPGLREGVHGIEGFEALRCCPADVGRWGAEKPLSESRVRQQLLERKGWDAWDPLDGPGWPGLYDDRRRLGVASADRRDVARRATFREAVQLWSQIDGRMAGTNGYQPYVVILRCRTAASSDLFRATMDWLMQTCFRDRLTTTCGLALLCATVVNETGFVVLATQGGREHEALLNDIEASTAPFCFAIDDQRIAFERGVDELSEDKVVEAQDKPKKREWRQFLKSPCGRFSVTSWWRDGSNYPFADALLEMKGNEAPDRPTAEPKRSERPTSAFAYGASNCRIVPDILADHEEEVRAARERWAESDEFVGGPSSKTTSAAPDLYGEVEREDYGKPTHPAAQSGDDYFMKAKRDAEERFKKQEQAAPPPQRPWKYQDVDEEVLPEGKRAWKMDGEQPLESLFAGLREMGCNVETGASDSGFRFSYGGGDKKPSPAQAEKVRQHEQAFEDRYPGAPDHLGSMFEKAQRAAEAAREPTVSLETPLDELLDPATNDDRVDTKTPAAGVPESKGTPLELREGYM